jgi:hypothetical protein
MEAVKIRLLFVENNRSAIMVNISVVITLLMMTVPTAVVRASQRPTL